MKKRERKKERNCASPEDPGVTDRKGESAFDVAVKIGAIVCKLIQSVSRYTPSIPIAADFQ